MPVNHDAVPGQDFVKQLRRIRRRIFCHQLLAVKAVIHGYRSPCGHGMRALIAMHANLVRSSSCNGENAALHFVIRGGRVQRDKGAVAWLFSGKNIHENQVVINCECRNRSAEAPLQIVLRPAGAVGFIDVEGIVGHHVAINILDPCFHHLVRHIFKDDGRRLRALHFECVRHGSP